MATSVLISIIGTIAGKCFTDLDLLPSWLNVDGQDGEKEESEHGSVKGERLQRAEPKVIKRKTQVRRGIASGQE